MAARLVRLVRLVRLDGQAGRPAGRQAGQLRATWSMATWMMATL